MSGKEGRGVNRYMLEEVYFSKSAEEGNRNIPNPQNCYYDEASGRWYYDYPAMWYNNISGNKAIGLRKIDVFADSLLIYFDLNIQLIQQKSGEKVQSGKATFRMQFDSSSTTRDICDAIKNWYYNESGFVQSGMEYLDLTIMYNDTKTALEWIFEPHDFLQTNYHWAVNIVNASREMNKWLNCELASQPESIPTPASDGRLRYTCPDVWNREFLFLHASFVNGTSFNYLGRSGEFYPKPSKMYQAAPSSQQFYFEISFNGRTPIKFKHVSFIVDLAYIYYDKDYKAE